MSDNPQIFVPTMDEKMKLIDDLCGIFPYFFFIYDNNNVPILIQLEECLQHSLDIKISADGTWQYDNDTPIKPESYQVLLAYLIRGIARDEGLLPYHITHSMRAVNETASRIEKKMDAIYDMLTCLPGTEDYNEAKRRFDEAKKE